MLFWLRQKEVGARAAGCPCCRGLRLRLLVVCDVTITSMFKPFWLIYFGQTQNIRLNIFHANFVCAIDVVWPWRINHIVFYFMILEKTIDMWKKKNEMDEVPFSLLEEPMKGFIATTLYSSHHSLSPTWMYSWCLYE